jgi:hypothetical protein
MQTRTLELTLKAKQLPISQPMGKAEVLTKGTSGGVGPVPRTHPRGTGPSVPRVFGPKDQRPAVPFHASNVTVEWSVRVGRAREAKRARAGLTNLPSRERNPSPSRPMRVRDYQVPPRPQRITRRIKRLRPSFSQARLRVRTSFWVAQKRSSWVVGGWTWAPLQGLWTPLAASRGKVLGRRERAVPGSIVARIH